MAVLRPTGTFRRDLRRLKRQGEDLSSLKTLLTHLHEGTPLPKWSRDAVFKDTVRRCFFGAKTSLLYERDEKADQIMLIAVGLESSLVKSRPHAASWLKTLLRSPVKTLLTFLLIATVTFGLVSQTGEYSITAKEYADTMALYKGVGAVDVLERPTDADQPAMWYNALKWKYDPADRLLVADRSAEEIQQEVIDLYNEAGLPEVGVPAPLFEKAYYAPLSAEQIEQITSLPGVSQTDLRTMTAGYSDSYVRLEDAPEGDLLANHLLIVEGTLEGMETGLTTGTKERILADGTDLDEDFYQLHLTDCRLLGGVAQGFCVDGAALTVNALAWRTFPSAGDYTTIGFSTIEKIVNASTDGKNTYAKEYRYLNADYDSSYLEQYGETFLQTLVPGERYLFCVEYEPITPKNEDAGLVTDTLFISTDGQDHMPPVLSAGDVDEEILSFAAFCTAQARTFDVVYTGQMDSIKSAADGYLFAEKGRFLEPADTELERDVCVISHDLAESSGLKVGDVLTLTLNRTAVKPLVWYGAKLEYEEMILYRPENSAVTLEIVGIYGDRAYRDRMNDPFWSYTNSTIFVPQHLLPLSEAQLEDHEYIPSEFSFVVPNGEDILSFSKQSQELFEELGLRSIFNDGYWATVVNAYETTKTACFIRIGVLLAASMLSLGLAVYLFISRRKRDYGILRALGTPKRSAGLALLAPLLALSSCAVVAGAAAGHVYVSRSVETRQVSAAFTQAAPTVSIWIALLCAAALILLALLFAFVYLRALSTKMPMELLQDSMKTRQTRLRQEVLSHTAPSPLADVLPEPVTRPTKPAGAGFTIRYVLRHIRRARLRSILAVLAAAILLCTVGQFVLVRMGYEQIYSDTPLAVEFLRSSTPYAVERDLVSRGWIDRYYYKNTVAAGCSLMPADITAEKFVSDYLTAEAEQAALAWTIPLKAVMTNDLAKASSRDYPIDYAEEYDASALKTDDNVILLSTAAAEATGVVPGQQILLMPNGLGIMDSIYQLQSDYVKRHRDMAGAPLQEIVPHIWEEALTNFEEYADRYTVIGIIRDEGSDPWICAPASASTHSPLPTTMTCDVMEAYLSSPDHIVEVQTYCMEKYGKDSSSWHLDSSKIEGILHTLTILRTVYPVVLAAALLIGGFLAALFIVQNMKEAAILRVLGTTQRRTRYILSSEQILLAVIGMMVGAGTFLIWRGAKFFGISHNLAVFSGAYLFTAAAVAIACAILVTRRDLLSLLQVKE